MGCADGTGGLGLVPALLAQADCHAEALASGGYGALTGGGGLAPALATAALTLYVAFLGWRLLSGHAPHIGGWSLALIKVGFVLALTSQWPVYQKLVYDTATRGPEEIAQAVLGGYRARSGEPAVGRASLQRTYAALTRASQAQAPGPTAAEAPVSDPSVPEPPAAPARAPAAPSQPGSDFARAALLLLLSTAGVMVAAKLLTALMLALGPLVLLLLLFEQTRGLTVGWARALFGLALTLLVGEVLATVEVSLLRPVLRASTDGPAQGAAAVAVTAVCALTLLLGIVAVWAVALGLRPKSPGRTVETEARAASAPPIVFGAVERAARPAGRLEAFAVPNGALARREARAAQGGTSLLRAAATYQTASESAVSAAAIAGAPPRRLAMTKVSAAADRRDR